MSEKGEALCRSFAGNIIKHLTWKGESIDIREQETDHSH